MCIEALVYTGKRRNTLDTLEVVYGCFINPFMMDFFSFYGTVNIAPIKKKEGRKKGMWEFN